ncbi:MAG: isochorismatase family protein [Achromobacter sp.]|uniref:isochorismatase family protein n=1 Tax=Achromobacter sp. TaxID=134375 RepID=UPI0029A602FF|nr:isochorismatase family protein [Achromobacter sp.]MDX3985721.1 isochorismatase family protein [Achromobacter sp.]
MSTRAIIAIDRRKEYLPADKLGPLGIDQVVANAVAVSGDARTKGALAVNVRHESAGLAAMPVFRPVVPKYHPNSFLKTDLKKVLDDHGIKEAVIVGAMSHMCVDVTTRAASDLGYPVTGIHDACSTRDVEFGNQTVAAAQVHTAVMSALAFAYV